MIAIQIYILQDLRDKTALLCSWKATITPGAQYQTGASV